MKDMTTKPSVLEAAIVEIRDAGLTLEDLTIRNWATAHHIKNLMIAHDGKVYVATRRALDALDKVEARFALLLGAAKAAEARLRQGYAASFPEAEVERMCPELKRLRTAIRKAAI